MEFRHGLPGNHDLIPPNFLRYLGEEKCLGPFPPVPFHHHFDSFCSAPVSQMPCHLGLGGSGHCIPTWAPPAYWAWDSAHFLGHLPYCHLHSWGVLPVLWVSACHHSAYCFPAFLLIPVWVCLQITCTTAIPGVEGKRLYRGFTISGFPAARITVHSRGPGGRLPASAATNGWEVNGQLLRPVPTDHRC